MSKIIGVTTATPYSGIPALIDEVSTLKKEVETSIFPQIEICTQTLNLQYMKSSAGYANYRVKNQDVNISLEANEEYIFSIPVGNYGNVIVNTNIGNIYFTHDGEKYVSKLTPSAGLTITEITEVLVHSNYSDFPTVIELVVGKKTSIDERMSEVEEEVEEVKAEVQQIANSLLYEKKELYEIQPYWTRMGAAATSKGYCISDSTELDLIKAGEEYTVSIITPQIGEYANIEHFIGSLYYKEDRYTGKVEAVYDIPTLDGAIADFNISSPENEISDSAKIVIAKETSILEKFGDIDSALDGIIAIQENLIGGGSV